MSFMALVIPYGAYRQRWCPQMLDVRNAHVTLMQRPCNGILIPSNARGAYSPNEHHRPSPNEHHRPSLLSTPSLHPLIPSLPPHLP